MATDDSYAFGRSAGRQVGRSAGQQVGRSAGQQVSRSAGQQVSRSGFNKVSIFFINNHHFWSYEMKLFCKNTIMLSIKQYQFKNIFFRFQYQYQDVLNVRN
ncbi:hypothetical protein C7N43_14290 [Sphingobacteriales bacterium UPWRP_1]|nr:hypothetical protein BVG80_11375 [Sphingobacteriales bacterium TSM_CSM]PSJ76380.1 hypothetical protein C7N43_14290 [Sphingobacteriales bacterium UPWRP_1]